MYALYFFYHKEVVLIEVLRKISVFSSTLTNKLNKKQRELDFLQITQSI